jgi:peptide/nickel transport system ATP-binding protein
MSGAAPDAVLAVDGLVVAFPAGRGMARVLDGVTLDVGDKEILGIVGETGSGKSLTLLSIMGLLPPPGRMVGGSIRYLGRELGDLDAESYRKLRGREIGTVVQNARAALNPLERVGKQMRNVYAATTTMRGPALATHARAMLAQVGFRDVDRVLEAYPHQLSGGMAQRVLIAIATGSSPRLIMVDEPTSGLDPTVAVRVMETLRRTIRETGAAGIVVTHDLGVVARFCDRAVVMRSGRVVDEAPVATFFAEPRSPARARLIEAHSLADIDPAANVATAATAGTRGT